MIPTKPIELTDEQFKHALKVQHYINLILSMHQDSDQIEEELCAKYPQDSLFILEAVFALDTGCYDEIVDDMMMLEYEKYM